MKFVVAILGAFCLFQSAIGSSVPLRLGFGSDNAIKSHTFLTSRILEKEINETLECFRMVLTDGLPEHNIPSFSPLEWEGLDFNLSSLGIPEANGFLNVANVRVEGLMDWITSHIKGTLHIIGGMGASIEVTMDFPTLHIRTDYETDLQIEGIKVFGKGEITLDLTNFVLALDVKAMLGRLEIDTMNILPTVDNITAKFTGLFHDEEQSELVNKLLNSILTNWMNEKSQDISDAITGIIKEIINTPPSTEEPSEPGTSEEPEEPSIIDIILAQCNEEQGMVLRNVLRK